MKRISSTQVTKDFGENSLLVSRVFNAPVEKVWQAKSKNQLSSTFTDSLSQ